MQGVVDHAHWLAFALVLVSVVRTDREWRTLLGVNVGIMRRGCAIRHRSKPRLEHGLSGRCGRAIMAGHGESRQLRVPRQLRVAQQLRRGRPGGVVVLRMGVATGRPHWPLPAHSVFWPQCSTSGHWRCRRRLAPTGHLWAAPLGWRWSLPLFAVGRVWRLAAVGGLAVAGAALAVLAFLFFVSNPLTTRTDNPVLLRLSGAGVETLTTRDPACRLGGWHQRSCRPAGSRLGAGQLHPPLWQVR